MLVMNALLIIITLNTALENVDPRDHMISHTVTFVLIPPVDVKLSSLKVLKNLKRY